MSARHSHDVWFVVEANAAVCALLLNRLRVLRSCHWSKLSSKDSLHLEEVGANFSDLALDQESSRQLRIESQFEELEIDLVIGNLTNSNNHNVACLGQKLCVLAVALKVLRLLRGAKQLWNRHSSSVKLPSILQPLQSPKHNRDLGSVVRFERKCDAARRDEHQ